MLRALNKKEGFTLIELLIVVAIIGILAAIAIPQFAAYRAKAYCASVKSDLANFAIAEEAYFVDNNAYAAVTTLEGFKNTTGVTVTPGTITVANQQGFTATGSHAQCGTGGANNAGTYNWNSLNKGLGGL